MSNIIISNEAYEEFKGFLDYNKVENYNLRITYLGKKCSGPIFNISSDTVRKDDIVEAVKDINFLLTSDLINEYGGFIILSNEENKGHGLILKPVIEPVNSCNICPGC
jgi:iron-sulfur cluster insertion protein